MGILNTTSLPLNRGVAFLTVVAAGIALAGPAVGDDWPQWRGPNRDAKIAGFTAPTAWPKTLTKKWNAPVGEAVASPVLVGDKIYVFTLQGSDDVVTCLNAADGKEIWKDKHDPKQPVTGVAGGFKGQESFKGPRATPAVGEGKVCTFGAAGTVSCLDAATGKLAWRVETKAKPMFFTSSSPIIIDGKCIVQVGGQGKGDLVAYNLADGKEAWKCPGDGPGYASPVLATIGGVKQIVALGEKNLTGVALSDGKKLWETPFTVGRYNTGTPVIDGDTVICMGSSFKIEKMGDAFTVTKGWKGQVPANYNTPVLKDGLLYGLAGGGGKGAGNKIFCQDAKTGETVWTDNAPRGECGEILDAGSVLICLSSNSDLVVFKPGKAGFEEVAKYKVSDTPTWAYPIVTGKRVIVKDRESVTLWSLD